jgi:hypothetical protein
MTEYWLAYSDSHTIPTHNKVWLEISIAYVRKALVEWAILTLEGNNCGDERHRVAPVSCNRADSKSLFLRRSDNNEQY